MPITFTMKRSSEESGLSVRQLYTKIGTGELESVVVAGRRLIPARALENFLLGRRDPTQEAPKPQTSRPTGGASRLHDPIRKPPKSGGAPLVKGNGAADGGRDGR
jgi:hypothetical protein